MSQTTLKQWEAQANAYKPFQGVWYNKVDEVERMLVRYYNEVVPGCPVGAGNHLYSCHQCGDWALRIR